jgi:hypothetical protein
MDTQALMFPHEGMNWSAAVTTKEQGGFVAVSTSPKVEETRNAHPPLQHYSGPLLRV